MIRYTEEVALPRLDAALATLETAAGVRSTAIAAASTVTVKTHLPRALDPGAITHRVSEEARPLAR